MNESLNAVLIVGGGSSGLLVANLLHRKNVAFLGLESSDRLGGRLLFGHHRAYSHRTMENFKENLGELEWVRIDDAARERRKGEWREPEADISEEELFQTRSPYYLPKIGFRDVAERLAGTVASHFSLRKEVSLLDLESRQASCVDGSQYGFERLLWCASLDGLVKACPRIKLPKNRRRVPGQVHLEMELKTPVTELRNSILFRFRHKEKKRLALGIVEDLSSGLQKFRWSVQLDEEIAGDREEIAMCVRSLKRELLKEFPELKDNTGAERLIHVPEFCGLPVTTLKSLEVCPGVFYAGAEARQSDSDETLWDVDLATENYSKLTEQL